MLYSNLAIYYMANISIKDVAKYYAELPNQNKGLDMLQSALDKVGLANEEQGWVQEFRKAEKPGVKLELPVSVAAKESQVLPFNGIVDWNNPRSRVSKYFTVAEVTQNDPRRRPQKGSNVEKNILLLAGELDKIRYAWGSAIVITSWYRPAAINAAVGGVSNSQHINGGAVDIACTNNKPRDFERWLDNVAWKDRALGYGIASGRGFTHLDLRNGRIRWRY